MIDELEAACTTASGRSGGGQMTEKEKRLALKINMILETVRDNIPKATWERLRKELNAIDARIKEEHGLER